MKANKKVYFITDFTETGKPNFWTEDEIGILDLLADITEGQDIGTPDEILLEIHEHYAKPNPSNLFGIGDFVFEIEEGEQL